MEKKIYIDWAFTDKARWKSTINMEIYDKIKKKGKLIKYNEKLTDENRSKYMCYIFIKREDDNIQYKILSNPKGLSMDEIALIIDNGNLSCGYDVKDSNIFIIYTEIQDIYNKIDLFNLYKGAVNING